MNIGSIDAQHRSLLAIGRELCTAMSTGQSRALTYNIVDRLAQYTATHFAHEERLMRAQGYPDTAAHQAEHEALAAKVAEFRTDFKAGRATMPIELLQSMESSITGTSRARIANTRCFSAKKPSPEVEQAHSPKPPSMLFLCIRRLDKDGSVDSKPRELCGPRDEQAEGAHALAGPGKGGGDAICITAELFSIPATPRSNSPRARMKPA